MWYASRNLRAPYHTMESVAAAQEEDEYKHFLRAVPQRNNWMRQ